MIKLAAGIILWSIAHFMPTTFTGLRSSLIKRMGENAYKGLFLVAMIGAIALIISGWKSTIPEALYVAPMWGRHACAGLMLIAIILFFAPYPPNNIRRKLRHPQLTAVMLWGVGHLLANGEMRSVLLFGGFAVWALVQIVMINRRDGAWTRPAAAPRMNDVFLIIGGIAVYILVVSSHQWLFGFRPY